MIEQADCLIFDLDGTLYEDTDHFDYYAQLLEEHVDDHERQAFYADYRASVEGNHPLSIGKVYDIQNDVILTVDPFSNQVEDVEEWDGKQWREEKVHKDYPDPLIYDFERLIALGDGWWLPFSVAMHYGISPVVARECYVKTKKYMVSNQFQMTKTKGLKKALQNWREEKLLILVTNSEDYDVDEILSRIELKGIFHEIIPSAKKPAQTLKIFRSLVEKHELDPERVVSIGDNFMNEIAPALQLEMKALFIQPHGFPITHTDLKVVDSLEEICN